MASPEEIKFAKNRFELQTMLNECFAPAEECLGLDCTALGASLDSFTQQPLPARIRAVNQQIELF